LTRNDWERHGSIANGQHGRPSALVGGVVGAVTFMEVVASVACTQPYLELAIRQGLTATKVGRCENRATTLECGEAGSRRGVGNGEWESVNDAQTGRLARKEHVRLRLTGGHLPEPARTRLPVCHRMTRLKPVVEALMNNLRWPFFFFAGRGMPAGPDPTRRHLIVVGAVVSGGEA
jgi:hypothetical protein